MKVLRDVIIPLIMGVYSASVIHPYIRHTENIDNAIKSASSVASFEKITPQQQRLQRELLMYTSKELDLIDIPKVFVPLNYLIWKNEKPDPNKFEATAKSIDSKVE